MKTAIKLFGFIATVAIITFSMAACEQPTDDPAGHTHQWGAWEVTTAATCIATGSQTRTCALNATHTETEEIAIDLVNGHDWDFDNVVSETIVPTCTTKGSGMVNCKRNGCNETNTGTDNIPALGHDYQTYTETTAPTCTTVGKEEAPCTRDSNHEKGIRDIPINPDTHAYGNWITTAPTCTTTGIDTRTCSLNATHKETRNETAINPTAHNWNTETGLCDNDCGALYYELGDTGPGGGKIFYVSAEGFTMIDDNSTAHYLEAAPADMTTSLEWASTSYQSTDITDTATAIGTGRKNTALILATDTDAPAAKACNDYNNGGKTDWFLPSKDELNQLYVNRTSVGNLKTTVDYMNYTHTYWSSSQYSNINCVWEQYFDNGVQLDYPKFNTYSVRAIRAF